MTLADILTGRTDLAGPIHPTDTRRCTIGRAIDNLNPDDKTALVDALHPESGWATNRLAKTLTLAGHRISEHSLYRHRAQVCICTHYDDTPAAT